MSINVAGNILLALTATPSPEQAVEEAGLDIEFTLDVEVIGEREIKAPLVPQQQFIPINKGSQSFVSIELPLEVPELVEGEQPSKPSLERHEIDVPPPIEMDAKPIPSMFVDNPPIVISEHKLPPPPPKLDTQRITRVTHAPKVGKSSRVNIDKTEQKILPQTVEVLPTPRQNKPAPVIDTTRNAVPERQVETPKQPLQTDAISGVDRAIFDKPDLVRNIAQPAQLTPSVVASTQTTPMKVISQIIPTLPSTPGDTIELRLDPPELGRVVVSITQTDSGLTALITAEKPEVFDLLRRNAELLQREFLKSGLGDATLNFAHKEQNSHNSPFTSDDIDLSLEVVENIEPISVATVLSQTDSLDIRL